VVSKKMMGLAIMLFILVFIVAATIYGDDSNSL